MYIDLVEQKFVENLNKYFIGRLRWQDNPN